MFSLSIAMLILVGVTLVSTLGWLAGLCCSRSAARRHLVLSSTLAACLLLPMAMSVRSNTDWTLLAVRTKLQAGGAEVTAAIPPVAGSSPERVAAPPAPAQAQSVVRSDARPLAEAAGLPAANNAANAPSREQDLPRAEAARAKTGECRQSASSVADVPARGVSATEWAWSVYALVAALLLVRLLARLVLAQFIRRQATKIDTLPGGIRVLEADVPVPLALGFGTSAIVLPRGFHQTFTPAELQDVLTHEVEHLRRGDQWGLLLQGIAAAAYWPILSVHLLNRALARACEELCDNAVLVGRDPVAYGQTLLAVAQRTLGDPAWANPLTSAMIGRGELERRVAALLEVRRDPRTCVGRAARWSYAAGLCALAVLVATTRAVGIAEEPRPSASTPGDSKPGLAAPKNEISWTAVPKIDRDDPAVQRGVVLGPDGKPLAGAAVYAVADEKLPGFNFELPDRFSVKDLGPQRAETDTEGRFEFTANDLTFVTYAGKRARVETLLVATKDGLAPGWFRTWGEVAPYHHYFDLEGDDDILLRTRPAATLTGRLEFEAGRPIVGARVEVVELYAPIDYDLDQHLERQERIPHFVEDGIKYAAGLNWPRILGPSTEATTDAEGRFELPGLPEGFIAMLEVTHPKAVTTKLRVAIRAVEPIREDPSLVPGPLTLYGSGFTARLAKGIALSGRAVRVHDGLTPAVGVAGVTIAARSPNAGSPGFPQGYLGQRFLTDADGNFTVTGLADRPDGRELAFLGSFTAPYYNVRRHFSREEPLPPGYAAREKPHIEVQLTPAVRYRLRITDPSGRPVDRNVYSTFVQREPGEKRHDVQDCFNCAQHVAPGVYEGIVPPEPAVVMIFREFMTDRPAAVDPKAFFAPGRTDWTPEEEQFAYGDAWRIAMTAIAVCDLCSPNLNPMRDQRHLAAAVFTNAKNTDEVLELQATVYSDPPVSVTLVDDAGEAVERATVERQIEDLNGFRGDVLPEDARRELPATFVVYGLHPDRAETLLFRHQKRGLVGTLTTKWTDEPLRVVMRPEVKAKLTGRLVDKSGKPSADIGIRLKFEGAKERDWAANRWNGNQRTPFNVTVPPGVEIEGQFVRLRKDWKTRSPSLGTAFGPLTVKAGETVDLGDIIVP